MLRHLHKRSTWMLLAGLAMGLLVGVGMMIGTLVAVRSAPATALLPPETLLHATASHSGKSMAMATGLVDEEAEGVFILDYLTGDVQCYVINPRTYQWGGMFKYNVINDLGVQQGKDPNYVMVTGQTQFLRRDRGYDARDVRAVRHGRQHRQLCGLRLGVEPHDGTRPTGANRHPDPAATGQGPDAGNPRVNH